MRAFSLVLRTPQDRNKKRHSVPGLAVPSTALGIHPFFVDQVLRYSYDQTEKVS